ncbi:MAG: NfeD family protein [Bacteroidia bacterium]
MSLLSIILLILIALFLLMMEILFVPGMVLGFISIILMLVGIIFSFKDYGTTTGIIVLTGTTIASIVSVYLAFHSSLWKKLQVKSLIDGKANEIEKGAIKIGDTGKTISRLNPMGKALINDLTVEVQVIEGFIDQDKDITVIKVQQNKIFVKLK